MIRKAFVPRHGKAKRKIFSADYSQIELRILAHFSGDKNLTLAFQEDRDIHRFTATLLYGVKEEDVTREMRNVAKTINFSIIYGKTAFGLSQDLDLSISEADGFDSGVVVVFGAIAVADGVNRGLAARQDLRPTVRPFVLLNIQRRNRPWRAPGGG